MNTRQKWVVGVLFLLFLGSAALIDLWPSPPSVTAKMLPDGTGYIRFHSFKRSTAVEEMQKAFDQLANAKAIVFDLRDNQGGQPSYTPSSI